MKRLLVVIGFFFLAACGKSPVITQPAEGQQFALVQNQYQCFDILLEDYDNTTITVLNQGAVQGLMSCNSGQNAPARCCQASQYGGGFQPGGGYGGQVCPKERPCTLFIVVEKDGQKDYRSVQVYLSTGQQ